MTEVAVSMPHNPSDHGFGTPGKGSHSAGRSSAPDNNTDPRSNSGRPIKVDNKKQKKIYEQNAMLRFSEVRLFKKKEIKLSKENARKILRKIPIELLARDWLNDSKATVDIRAYMVDNVFPTLILGVEKLLTEVDSRQLASDEINGGYNPNFNPVNYLAQYLMRNNPRYSNFSEASPYVRGLRQIAEELKAELFDMEDNRLARIKKEVKHKREERELQVQLKQQETERRQKVFMTKFAEWNVTTDNNQVELSLLQNTLRSFVEVTEQFPAEVQDTAKYGHPLEPTDETGRTLSLDEFARYLSFYVENLPSEVFEEFMLHMAKCALAYRAAADREYRRIALTNLFIQCDHSGIGQLDRHRILNLFEKIWDSYKDSKRFFRNPRKWPVVEVDEADDSFSDEEDDVPTLLQTMAPVHSSEISKQSVSFTGPLVKVEVSDQQENTNHLHKVEVSNENENTDSIKVAYVNNAVGKEKAETDNKYKEEDGSSREVSMAVEDVPGTKEKNDSFNKTDTGKKEKEKKNNASEEEKVDEECDNEREDPDQNAGFPFQKLNDTAKETESEAVGNPEPSDKAENTSEEGHTLEIVPKPQPDPGSELATINEEAEPDDVISTRHQYGREVIVLDDEICHAEGSSKAGTKIEEEDDKIYLGSTVIQEAGHEKTATVKPVEDVQEEISSQCQETISIKEMESQRVDEKDKDEKDKDNSINGQARAADISGSQESSYALSSQGESSQNLPDSSQNLPDSSQNLPDSSQNLPNSSQNLPDSSENLPNSSQSLPISSQNLLKSSQNLPNSIQNLPNSSQNLPDSSQNLPDSSQNLPDSSQNLPDSSQNLPNSSQNLPDASQNLPNSSQNLPESSQNLPNSSQNLPDASQNLPNSSQNLPDSSQNLPNSSQNLPNSSQNLPNSSQNLPPSTLSSEMFLLEAGTEYGGVTFAEGTSFERQRTNLTTASANRSQSQLSAFDESSLNVSQFVQLTENFLGENPFKAAFEKLVMFIREGYEETEDEKMERLLKAHKEAISASHKAQLDALFEKWDNDGCGYLDLADVEEVMLKYKEGQEKNTIAKAQEELKKQSKFIDSRLDKQEFRNFVTLVIEKLPGDSFEYFVEFLTNSVERSYAERVRGEARKKWLQMIINAAETGGISLESVYKAVFQALYRDAETHGGEKRISANIALLERNTLAPQRGDVMLRYTACTPEDAKYVFQKILFRDMKGISFAAVDSGKPVHVPRVSTHGNIQFWNTDRTPEEREGSFIVVPLKDRKKRVFGVLGIDTLYNTHGKAIFITHEIQFFQGVAQTFSIAYHLIDMRRKLLRITESAISWIKRRAPQVTEIMVYMVEPGKSTDFVLRRMMTTDKKGFPVHIKDPPVRLERKDNLFRDYLFKCVDNSETVTADAYGNRHLAFPLRDNEGKAIALVDINIGHLRKLPAHENKETQRMLRLLQQAHREITQEFAGEDKMLVLDAEKDDETRMEIMFDRLMLMELRENVSKLDSKAWAELRAYNSPPEIVLHILRASLSIFYPELTTDSEFDSWSKIRSYINGDLIQKVQAYDPTLSTDLTSSSVIEEYLKDVPHGEVTKHGSLPAQYLYNWVFVCLSLIDHTHKMRQNQDQELLPATKPSQTAVAEVKSDTDIL